MVIVPFKLIDILLRFGFAVILLPLFIVCLATPATRKYSETGFKMLISGVITLITLCLFLAFAIQLVVTALA